MSEEMNKPKFLEYDDGIFERKEGTSTARKLSSGEIVEKLNEMYEENIKLSVMFAEIVETAIQNRYIREMYSEGVMGIFEECESLDEARKVMLEVMGLDDE